MAASVLLTIAAVVACVVQVNGADEAALLRSCWNAQYDSTPNSFQDWTAGRPIKLYMVDSWWSKHDSGIPLTVFTPGSISRLGALEAQCRGYVGPLSAALYLPLLLEEDPSLGSSFATGAGRHLSSLTTPADPVANARAMVQDLFDRMEQLQQQSAANASSSCCCQLRLVLLAERLADRALAALMPINAMRNAALLSVTTPLSVMLDVDLGFSANINSLVRNQTWLQNVMREATAAPRRAQCIPPAWENAANMGWDTKNMVVQAALAGTKQRLVSMWQSSLLQVFQEDVCRKSHAPFNHTAWAAASAPYEVTYSLDFEPWGILWRLEDPGYDERLRGWFYDKQMYAETLARKHDYRFVVLPDVWLVHRPHKKMAVAQIYQEIRAAAAAAATGKSINVSAVPESKDKDAQAMLKVVRFEDGRTATIYQLYRTYVDDVHNNFRATLAARQPYDPHKNPQVLKCMSVLPWCQRKTSTATAGSV